MFTDSLTYEIQTKDIYVDMQAFSDMSDTSDYPQNHFLNNEKNRKTNCKFKDELNGRPIFEFIGLRLKAMYSIMSSDG